MINQLMMQDSFSSNSFYPGVLDWRLHLQNLHSTTPGWIPSHYIKQVIEVRLEKRL